MDALKDATGQYLFTSTRAVYTDFTAPVMNEDAPVGPKDLPESEWGGYGPNKVLAERVVEGGVGARTLIVRPPVIVGPGDRSDRFTYWPDRIDAGGEVLVQGDPSDPVQFVDVRDLAEFHVHLLEEETAGIFNSVGPARPSRRPNSCTGFGPSRRRRCPSPGWTGTSWRNGGRCRNRSLRSGNLRGGGI